jgi:hypothetical protein
MVKLVKVVVKVWLELPADKPLKMGHIFKTYFG